MRTLTIVAVLLLLGAGCNTPGKDISGDDGRSTLDQLNAAAEGPSSGRSSAETTTTDFPFGPAVAWGASQATSNATAARYSPTNTNSGTGSLVTGFVQGLTAEQRASVSDAIARRIADDAVLQSISDELRYLMDSEEYSPEWQARTDALREQYRASESAIMAELAESGVTSRLDLGNLEQLVVTGIIVSIVGAEERPPTDAEVKALAKLLPDLIAASKGNETIQRDGAGEEEEID